MRTRKDITKIVGKGEEGHMAISTECVDRFVRSKHHIKAIHDVGKTFQTRYKLVKNSMWYGRNTNERFVALDNIIEPPIADGFWR